MRATDVHMSAAIDVEKRIVLVTGSIDTDEYQIIMRVPLPSAGEWTLIKAETNLTNDPWIAWQMQLGEGISIPMKDGQPELLTSRNYGYTRYIPESNSVIFHGGGEENNGEVRPGEPILKFAKIETGMPEIVAAHSRMIPEELPEFDTMIRNGNFKNSYPKMEVITPVTYLSLPEVFVKEETAVQK